MPGVVYAAGVRHAYNLAVAFRDEGLKAQAVSGETPKRELASILARYERGDIDVLINAQLLAEGWNSPRATVCVHLAPTASKRIYQQRVGRVTRRHPGKEAGLVVDFVHPATKHDDPVVTLHSLLDRDVYRGGAIVVGPVRRGRGRRVRVERRVLPVCPEPERRAEVFERELWRIAVEHLDYGEQHVWAALAGARVQANGWRRARAMLHFDRDGELRRRFLVTAVQRNPNPALRLKALAEIAAARDPDAFDTAIDMIGTWTREERREGAKIMLQAMVDKRIGRRDQANAWIWRIAEYTREVHEEYAVQRWPETKRLLGLLVNSSGAAHARNARRLVQAARKQDRRLAAALLAAALAHSPEAEEVLRGARTRMARKPPALARELLRNFPKRRPRGKRRRRRGEGDGDGASADGARHRGRPPHRARRRARSPTAPTGAPDGEHAAHAADRGNGGVRSEARARSRPAQRRTQRRRACRARRRRRRSARARGLTGAPPARGPALRRRRYGATRWTSPAPSSSWRPSSRRTRRCPRSSMPRAMPRPPFHSIALTEQRVALAPGVDDLRAGRASQSSSSSSSRSSAGSTASGARPSVPALSRSSGGSSATSTATLTPMPSTAQPSCGRPSIRMPATLRPSSSTSLGHFSAARGPGELGDRDGGRDRQERRRVAQHQRAQQRAPRRRVPAAALAAAAVALGVGGDERAVRRAGARERARVDARRAGHAAVHARRPEPRGRAALVAALDAHRARSASSSSRPRSSSAAAEPPLTASASVPRASR